MQISEVGKFDGVSTGWKDITVKLFGTNEQLKLPVMITAKVRDVKRMLAEIHNNINPNEIQLVRKLGPSYKRHRDGDEIATTVLVKGITSFAPGPWTWPHPYMVIGAGHMGLRQAMHYCRRNVPYIVVERFHDVGGNAWLTIANPTSKLQTEGPQYQLQYDVFDGNCKKLLSVENYAYWPTRAEIIKHFWDIINEYGVSANLHLSKEATEMVIQNPNAKDVKSRSYDFEWKSTKPGDDTSGTFRVSALAYYPGCLVVPHRGTWPGEEIFGGQIGYGFASEFDYKKVRDQQCVLIGMGAFAHENIRTIVEHGGGKTFNVARHFNLLMPRMVCWWINQSTCPPTAAMVLNAMEPMYKLCGWDPWTFFSVTSTPDRTVASIRQYTRWGISDIFFLACFYNKAEIIHGEVKRFKHRSVLLNTGQLLEDIDHIIKVIGFDGDFGVDRLMQCDHQVGPWPSGDYRRIVLSDQSAIDASRFTNIAISPAVSSMSQMVFYWHTHPKQAQAALDSGTIPLNYSELEMGSPCYHWTPRQGTVMFTVLSTFAMENGAFEELNLKLKKDSMHWLADERKYIQAVTADWRNYCKMFKDQGCATPAPQYPYSLEGMKRYLQQEVDLAEEEERKVLMRNGMSSADIQERQEWVREERKKQDEWEALMLDAGHDAEATTEFISFEDWERQSKEYQGQYEDQQRMEHLFAQDESGKMMNMGSMDPGGAGTFEAAKTVLLARVRAGSPPRDSAQLQEWLTAGHEMKKAMIDNVKGAGVPMLRS